MYSLTLLSGIKGVGKVTADKLEAIGLTTVADFAEYFPRKYSDYSVVSDIAHLQPGLVAIQAHLTDVKQRRVRRGLHITEAAAEDASGRVKVVWFNQPYRATGIKAGQVYYLQGEFGLQSQRLQLLNPSVEAVNDVPVSEGEKIVATYRESGELTSVIFRKIAAQLHDYFEQLPETIPPWLVKKYGLLPRGVAIRAIHLPNTAEELVRAKERLGFEELLVVMMAAQANREQTLSLSAAPVTFYPKIAQDFVKALPFDLTDSQRKVVWQIYKDMAGESPMNRLVEGDVGSGKTVVAAMAGLMVAHSGRQVAFIAPTELLAQQHAETLAKVFAHSPLKNKLAVLTGSLSAKAKKELKERLKKGEISIVVGTHAILQESVKWQNLGLVVIDEQHRFGVQQRQKLHAQVGTMPHILCLTATPIPRSLALTVYGELDISILDQAPSTRAGVDTSIVSPNSTAQMYASIEEQLKAGRQAYIVCPLITESEVLQTASAETTYDLVRKKELKNWRVGLLHGRLKADEKDAIMRAFVAHELDVLVATTVIEVGVDVSNAASMVILGADRFGLAQLHQLRGRVGRAQHKGDCYLVMSDSKAPPRRMRAIASTTDGFKLAELDLELRGPGAIYGLRQSGALDLRLVQLSDTKLISKTRLAVQELREKGENLLKYKQISTRIARAESLTYLN
jgi:ATP-dependent DNA helicase RecG